LEGVDRGLFQGTILLFDWGERGKSQRKLSVRR